MQLIYRGVPYNQLDTVFSNMASANSAEIKLARYRGISYAIPVAHAVALAPQHSQPVVLRFLGNSYIQQFSTVL
ncbi:MAG: DUF4278 domain-containing protein [Cyanobacteria bacterium J069]|nr:MAG: DUF4278 domain-containing protein [Cyanobacteria bacterium J069]